MGLSYGVNCSMFKKVHCLLFKNVYCLIFYFIMTSPQPSPLRQAQDKLGEGAKGKKLIRVDTNQEGGKQYENAGKNYFSHIYLILFSKISIRFNRF